MLCTDSLVNVAFRFTLKAFHHTPAQNIHVARLGYLIRETFDLNCRLSIALCPQDMNAFSENCNAGLLSLRSVCRCHNEIIKEVQKSSWIRHAIDHECRERVGGIQGNISALLNRSTNIQAVCLQSWKKTVPV